MRRIHHSPHLIFNAIKAGDFLAIDQAFGVLFDSDTPIKNDLTALEVAVSVGQYQIVYCLINKGVSINGRDSRISPLRLALQNEFYSIVQLLMMCGGLTHYEQASLAVSQKHLSGELPLKSGLLDEMFERSIALLPMMLFQALQFNKETIFALIIHFLKGLPPSVKENLRDDLIAIARFAAQTENLSALMKVADLLGENPGEGSFRNRPVLYWLLVNRLDVSNRDFVQPFHTDESKQLMLHYLQQDNYSELYARLGGELESCDSSVLSSDAALHECAGRASLALVKEEVIFFEVRKWLFEMELAYEKKDFVALNTLFRVKNSPAKEWFAEGVKANASFPLVMYFSLFFHNAFDVVVQGLQHDTASALDLKKELVQQHVGLSAQLTLACFQGNLKTLEYVKQLYPEKALETLFANHLFQHLRRYYDATLPAEIASSGFSVPQQALIAQQFQRFAISFPSHVSKSQVNHALHFLPESLWTLFISFFDGRDLISFRRSSRHFNLMSIEVVPRIWQHHVVVIYKREMLGEILSLIEVGKRHYLNHPVVLPVLIVLFVLSAFLIYQVSNFRIVCRPILMKCMPQTYRELTSAPHNALCRDWDLAAECDNHYLASFHVAE